MASLKGCCILIVDAEPMVGFDLKELLRKAGSEVLGPYGSAAGAIKAVHEKTVHAAVLDVNLSGDTAFEVADALVAAGVPFVWVTGYSPGNVPERLRSAPRLLKPYDGQMLLERLKRTVGPVGRSKAG
jgi:DNA-binding NarL/FixJ family response regulator